MAENRLSLDDIYNQSVQKPSLDDIYAQSMQDQTSPEVSDLNAADSLPFIKTLSTIGDLLHAPSMQDIVNRGGAVSDALTAGDQGQQTLPETVGQVALNGVGGLVSDTVASNTPDIVKNTTSAVMQPLLNNPVVNAGAEQIKPAIDSVQQYLDNNPRAARNIDALGNAINLGTMAVAPESKVAGTAGDALAGAKGAVQDRIGNAGTAIKESGQAAQDAARAKYIQDLVMPMENTAKQVEKNIGRKSAQDGLLGKTIVTNPSSREMTSASNIYDIENVSPKNLLQENFNAIDLANKAESKNLHNTLQESGISYNPEEVHSSIDESMANLKDEDPFVDETSFGAVDKAAKQMKKIMASNPSTAAGLLKSRQAFDKWAISKSKNVFSDKSGAFSTAVESIRDIANNHISALAPDAYVKDSLAKQNSFFNALKNVAPKAAREAPTPMGRFAQKAESALPFKKPAAQIGAGLGGIGIGAGALFTHPLLTGLGATGYGAYKLATMPETRIGLGSALERLGGQGVTLTNNPVQALNEARAAVRKLNGGN